MHWSCANPINNFVFFFLRISTRSCLSSVAVELYLDCKLYFSVVQGGSQTLCQPVHGVSLNPEMPNT